MAFRPARSLLHPYPEPLPPYTPRQTGSFDPETSSIHSNAPSYVSAAPSYHSGPRPTQNRASESGALSNVSVAGRDQSSSNSNAPSGLLSSQQNAPGFGGVTATSSSNDDRRRSNNLTNSHLHSLYNVSDWVPVAGGLQARHYHNVAKRRASEASRYDNMARHIFPPVFQGVSETRNGVSEPEAASASARSSPLLAAGMAGYSHRSSSTSILASLHEESVVHPRPRSPPQIASGNIAGAASSQTDLAAQLPVSPHEDPDLVGEAAAAMFRSQRLYITYQQQENYGIGAQPVSPVTGRPHQQASAGRTHQYSSLITPAEAATPPSTPPQEENRRPSTAPNASTTPTTQPEFDTRAQQQQQPQAQQQQQQQEQEQPPPSERQTTTGNTTTHHQQSASTLPTTATTTTSTISTSTTTTTTSTRPTRQYLDDDALCAQESKTWDFMLAQMADWEERERSWKKFKDDMDKKLNSGKLGMGFGIGIGRGRGWGSWSNSNSSSSGGGGAGGGKGKLKKASSSSSSSSHQFGHEKKWKRRVGLAS
ncbi:hypothetical protein EMPG_14663 [Blastomyces silverae]|uniref:Uncharacterized protein n=1 Tax=Blastomyces silverae TaxID=2060906 RepID=A0A0H1BEP2_9EURO|nr:hypothetical protein EMPG_14663 [Blastomyces silverae]